MEGGGPSHLVPYIYIYIYICIYGGPLFFRHISTCITGGPLRRSKAGMHELTKTKRATTTLGMVVLLMEYICTLFLCGFLVRN